MNYNDIFTYENGVLRWKIMINQGVYIGDVAGNKAHNGYLQVGCKGKMRLVHRIVWEMHNGQIAKGMQIDHINHIRHDNRIENLRLVSSSENSKNLSLRSDNTSSTTGVSWDKKSKLWYAKICVDKKQMNLGRFASFESAVNARKPQKRNICFMKTMVIKMKKTIVNQPDEEQDLNECIGSTEALITERGNRYGKFKDGAEIMRDLKHVMHEVDSWNNLSPSQKEALDMIQHKVGRILNGDPNYDDSWKDIAGYATLIVNELNGEIK